LRAPSEALSARRDWTKAALRSCTARDVAKILVDRHRRALAFQRRRREPSRLGLRRGSTSARLRPPRSSSRCYDPYTELAVRRLHTGWVGLDAKRGRFASASSRSRSSSRPQRSLGWMRPSESAFPRIAWEKALREDQLVMAWACRSRPSVPLGRGNIRICMRTDKCRRSRQADKTRCISSKLDYKLGRFDR
jgi:hypothetical protein